MELDKAQQVLVTLLQRQMLPQVVLFYGREGIPTNSLLTWLLRQLLCQQGNTCGARKRQKDSPTSEASGARKRQKANPTSEASGARKRQKANPTSEASGARKRPKDSPTSEASGARKRQKANPTSEASGICISCHALDNANHDDVLHYDAEQESFGVAEVSRLQSFLPLLGGSRVAIVHAAHQITRQAANKLLKILEEPPPTAYIFLTSTRYQQLLPTITSRCFHFLLKERGEPPRSSFTAQFEQLLTANQWSQRQPLLKKLREGKCSLQEFLFFYEQHLNHTYRTLLGRGNRQTHPTTVRRTRLHNIKQLLQQQISLNTQLGIESLLAAGGARKRQKASP